MHKLLVAAALAALSTTGANAASVLIIGNNSQTQIGSFLQGNGHSVSFSNGATGANYTGIDTVILLRTTGDAALTSFVNDGGRLITEWSGAAWALDTANLLAADTLGSADTFVATNMMVSFTAAGLANGLGTGVGASYSAGGASEFFHSFKNIGAGTEVWATRNGGAAAILAGRAGNGLVIANGIDWADGFSGGSANGQVLLNAISASIGGAAVPEPATWAMMIAGFGMVGAGMRRRRATLVIA